MEINFDNVSSSDQINIRTQNSTYNFEVLDPDERRGILSGGTLGNHGREAVLISSLDGDGGEGTKASPVLKPGTRALFYMTAKRGFERLITSVITGISHLNNEGDHRRAA
ncbi:MAG TPA: hypothetical protein VE262_03495 [Blastocatellia bacterium]|nr:hypothetical protein [Blastocatellia bacterium]